MDQKYREEIYHTLEYDWELSREELNQLRALDYEALVTLAFLMMDSFVYYELDRQGKVVNRIAGDIRQPAPAWDNRSVLDLILDGQLEMVIVNLIRSAWGTPT